MKRFIDGVSKGALIGSLGLMAVLIAGCGSSAHSGGTTPPLTDTLAAGGASTVYVVQQVYLGSAPSEILGFKAGSNGSILPTTTLTMPDGFEVLSMTADSAGKIYVGGTFLPGQNEMLEYDAGATGQATPIRTILDSGLLFTNMAVDSAGTVYVSGTVSDGFDGISVFSSGANGQTQSVRQIVGDQTQIYSPTGLAIDATGAIYAANFNLNLTGSILVFAPSATGNIAPIREITIADYPRGVAVGASGNIFVAATVYPSGPGKILEFAPGATGAAAPIRTIAGAATGMTINGGLKVDSVGNVYVATESDPPTGSGSLPVLSLLAFGPTADGDIVSAATYSSSSWFEDDDDSLEIAVH